MFIRKDVGERVDGPARNTGSPDLLGPLVRTPLAELLLQLRDQSLPVTHTAGVGRVALILGQLGTAYSSAQVGKLGVVTDGHDEGFVRRVEGLVGDDGGMGVAYETGVFAAEEILLPAVGEPAEGGLEERHLDARALSGRAAPVEGCQYGVGREQAAHYVRDRDAHLRRLAAWLARDTHDAAPRLHQEVVAGTVLLRPRAEARDGAVDQIWIRSFQLLVPQAELLQGPAPPVFDQDV